MTVLTLSECEVCVWSQVLTCEISTLHKLLRRVVRPCGEVVKTEHLRSSPKIECVVMRITEEQALKVRCPTCGAKRGEKCELSTGLPPDRTPSRSATGGLRTVKFSANSESTETKGGSSYPTLNRKSPLFLSLQVSRA